MATRGQNKDWAYPKYINTRRRPPPQYRNTRYVAGRWERLHRLDLPGHGGYSPLGTSYEEAERDVAKAKLNYLAQKAALKKEADENGWHISVEPFNGKYSTDVNQRQSTTTKLHIVPDLETLHQADGYASYRPIPGLPSTGRRFHKVYVYELSSVLARPTIWLPNNQDASSNKRTFRSAKGIVPESHIWPDDIVEDAPVAEWPSQAELKYEGSDRIATDRNNRRFMPVPRQSTNNTVAWHQKPYLVQHSFDQVYAGGPQVKPTAESIFYNNYEVGLAVNQPLPNGNLPTEGLTPEQQAERDSTNPLEGTEEDIGRHLIGQDLYMRLDPRGIYGFHKDF